MLHETEAKNADGTPKPRLSQTLNDVFLVMLLTAQRCGEVCQMQWREVDLVTGWWMIPGDVSKNHDPHRVPLTSMVLEILERRASATNADDRYVFSNHRHTCVADRAKKAAAILCNGGVSFHFRAHDLRRTAASYMGEAGVDRFHIAHVLNHRSVTHSTVTAIYDRYRYDKEKRAALETRRGDPRLHQGGHAIACLCRAARSDENTAGVVLTLPDEPPPVQDNRSPPPWYRLGVSERRLCAGRHRPAGRRRHGTRRPHPVLRKAEALLGREVNVTSYSVAEFRRKAAAKDHFLTEVLRGQFHSDQAARWQGACSAEGSSTE